MDERLGPSTYGDWAFTAWSRTLTVDAVSERRDHGGPAVNVRLAWQYIMSYLEARDERGAALIEYVFLVSLIAFVCIVAMQFFGNATAANLSSSASHITVGS
jgi:Flp pilus assembly pilin Flp